MTTRIIRRSKFCRPPLQQCGASELNVEAIREAILRKWWINEDEREQLQCVRRSRLSSERHAEMLADAKRGYQRLHSTPDERIDEIAEGGFWDDALTDPVIEE